MGEADEKQEEASGGGDDEDPLVRKRMGAGVGVTAIASRMTHDCSMCDLVRLASGTSPSGSWRS